MITKIAFCFILLLVSAPLAYGAPPVVSLISPANSNVTSLSNVTFTCNATSSENVFSISLYDSVPGSFSLNATKRIMELDADANTTLLCHFNNSYRCEGGEDGISSGTSFAPSKFSEGVLVNDSDTLRYPTFGNIQFQEGTIEFWINVGFNTTSGQYWLFDTSALDRNDIQFHVDNGVLYFEVIDDMTSPSTASKSISSWKMGEWHHVAAVWKLDASQTNIVALDLFLDGSNQQVSTVYGFSSAGQMESFLFIGSAADGTAQANSVFDEFSISNRTFTSSEINDSYLKGAGNHTIEAANFTVANVPDGTYLWNCLATDNQSQGSFSSQNFTFSVDAATPPSVNSISFSPSSDDDIDPGVTLNVTANITDPSNVSSAVFQYKYDVDFINVSMTRNGSLWNASFTTIGLERVYTYRIFTNDTRGNNITTQNYTLNVTWDYTWTRNSSVSEAFGFINNVSFVTILAINNTGDDTLIFTLTDDWPIVGVSYNSTSQFSVANKSVAYVNVSAKFAQSDGVSNMTITMSAVPAAPGKTASPASNTAVITMNSISGGPYFDVNILGAPTVITQSSYANLTATVRNIGNETAVGTWFNWSLPAGWTNTSGSLSTFMGNMSAQSATNTSTISVLISPSSAQSGIETICINATATGNTSNSRCTNIQVSCSNTDGVCGLGCVYTNDVDCPRPSAGGSSGSGVSSNSAVASTETASYGINITSPVRIDVLRGGNASFNISVNSLGSRAALRDVEVSFSGYQQTLMKKTPETIQFLDYNQTGIFQIEVDVPNYIGYGPYNITITVSGISGKFNSSNPMHVSDAASLILFVHSASESEAVHSLENAKAGTKEMEDAGFNTEYVNSLLNQLYLSLGNFDYDSIKEISGKVMQTRNLAFEVRSKLKDIEEDLRSAKSSGINAVQTEKLYKLALAAFERGDYSRASDRASNALLTGNIEIAGRRLFSDFFKNYWWLVIAVFAAVFLCVLVFRNKLAAAMVRRRLGMLGREESKIEEMTRSLQERFFRAKDIGKSEYTRLVHDHELRLAKIKSEKTRLLSSKTKLLGMGKKISFDEQKDRITTLIKDAQQKHFELGTMSKNSYNKTMKELKKELSELEKRPKKKMYVFAILLIIFLTPYSLAQNVTDNMLQATEALHTAEISIADMQSLGFPVNRANDTLAEATLLFSQKNYLGASSLARYVVVLKESAIEVNKMINDAEERVVTGESEGLNVSKARKLLQDGLDAFKSERYEESRELLKQSITAVDEEESRALIETTAKENAASSLLNYVKQNFYYIITALILASAIFFAFYKITEMTRLRNRIARMEKEKNRLEESAVSLQKDYFESRSITKSDYETRMKAYQSGLERIKKDLSMARDKITGKSRPA